MQVVCTVRWMAGHRPPLPGEELPLELANTRFMKRGVELDGLETTADLADWLGRVADRLPISPTEADLDRIGADELAAARELRDALRTLLTDATSGDPLDAGAADTLNRLVRAAPSWQELSVGPEPEAVVCTASPRVAAALAAIAQQAVSMLVDADTLRACAGPGCMLFYRKDHPRRAWCSPRCSNRARAARHYARRTGREL